MQTPVNQEIAEKEMKLAFIDALDDVGRAFVSSCLINNFRPKKVDPKLLQQLKKGGFLEFLLANAKETADIKTVRDVMLKGMSAKAKLSSFLTSMKHTSSKMYQDFVFSDCGIKSLQDLPDYDVLCQHMDIMKLGRALLQSDVGSALLSTIRENGSDLGLMQKAAQHRGNTSSADDGFSEVDLNTVTEKHLLSFYKYFLNLPHLLQQKLQQEPQVAHVEICNTIDNSCVETYAAAFFSKLNVADDKEGVVAKLNFKQIFEFIYHFVFFVIFNACRGTVTLDDLLSGNAKHDNAKHDAVDAAAAADADTDSKQYLNSLSPRAQALLQDKATYALPECLHLANLDEIEPWPELALDPETESQIFAHIMFDNDSNLTLAQFLEEMEELLENHSVFFGNDLRYLTTCGAVQFLLGRYDRAFLIFARVLHFAQNNLQQQITSDWSDVSGNELFAHVWGIESQQIELVNKILDSEVFVSRKSIKGTDVAKALAQDSALFSDMERCFKVLGINHTTATTAKSKRDRKQNQENQESPESPESQVSQVSMAELYAYHVREVLICVAFAKAALKRCTMGFSNLSACVGDYSYHGKWLAKMKEYLSADRKREDLFYAVSALAQKLMDCHNKIFDVFAIDMGVDSVQKARNSDEMQLLLYSNYRLANPVFGAITDPIFVPNGHDSDAVAIADMMITHMYSSVVNAYKQRRKSSDLFNIFNLLGRDDNDRKKFALFVDPYSTELDILPYHMDDALSSVIDEFSAEINAGRASEQEPRFRCHDFSGIKAEYQGSLSEITVQSNRIESWMRAYHGMRCLQWFERYNPFSGIADANAEEGKLRGRFVSTRATFENEDRFSVSLDKSMTFDQYCKIEMALSFQSLRNENFAQAALPVVRLGKLLKRAANIFVALTPMEPDDEQVATKINVKAVSNATSKAVTASFVEAFTSTGGAFATPLSDKGKALLEKLPFKVAYFNDSDTVAQQNGAHGASASASTMTAAERRKLEQRKALHAARHYLPYYKITFVHSDDLDLTTRMMLGSIVRAMCGTSAGLLCLNEDFDRYIADAKDLAKPSTLSSIVFGAEASESVMFSRFPNSRLISFNKKFVEGKTRVLVSLTEFTDFVRHCKFDERVSVTDIFDYQQSYKSNLTAAQARKYQNTAPMVLDAKEQHQDSDALELATKLSSRLYHFDIIAGETCCLKLVGDYCSAKFREVMPVAFGSPLMEADMTLSPASNAVLNRSGATAGFLIVPVDEISTVEYKGVKRKAIAKELASKLNAFMSDRAVGEAPRYDFVNESFTYMGYAAGREFIYVDYFIWDLEKFLAKALQLKDSGILQSYGVEHLSYHSFERLSDKVQLF